MVELNPDKIIMLPSITRTGTYFWVKFLINHPDITGFTQIIGLRNMLEGQFDGKTFTIPQLGERHTFSREGKVLVHFHLHANHYMLEGKQFMCTETTLLLCVLTPTLIPLKDPLASAISRARRKPNLLNSDEIHRQWDYLAYQLESLRQNPRFTMMPLDLQDTYEKKKAVLRKICDAVGITKTAWIGDYARKWPSEINGEGAYPLKKAYYNGDRQYLKENLGAIWNNLRKREQTLRPLLEEYGYRNLLWWS